MLTCYALAKVHESIRSLLYLGCTASNATGRDASDAGQSRKTETATMFNFQHVQPTHIHTQANTQIIL